MKKVQIKGVNIWAETHKAKNGAITKRWRVYLGAKFTGAQSSRSYFGSLKEANDYVRDEVKRRKEQGSNGYKLTAGQLDQATRAVAILGGRATLTEAVEYFVKHKCPKAGTKPIGAAVDAWIDAKKAQGRSAIYLARVSDIFKKAAKSLNCDVSEVTTAKLDKFLSAKKLSDGTPLSANSWNHYRMDLMALFNWCMSKGWCADNPAKHLEEKTQTTPEIGILNPLQALTLLNAAKNESGQPMLGFVILALFAGLRTAELKRLDWSAVILTDPNEPRVIVPANVAKDKALRVVDLSQNAVEWLKLIPFKIGKVAAVGNLDARLSNLRKSITSWPHNATRHSFLSYFSRLNGDSVAADAAGHESVKITRKSYKSLVSKLDANSYFSIYPTTTVEQLTELLTPALQKASA